MRSWRKHRFDWGPHGVSLVAELDRRVVGQITARRGARTVTRHVAGFGITVATSARDIGVGRALLQVVETWAREHDVVRLELAVFPGNQRAIALYRSHGYVEEGVERAGVRFPEGAIDVIKMSKLL